jgi:GT2 family glycosyltransferase
LNSGKPLAPFKGKCIEVSTLTGRGVLFPVSVFTEIGVYDQKHFEHRGDTEFPVRAKHAGYSLLVSYDAVVRSHVECTYSVDVARSFGFKDMSRYFFDIRSSGRLKFRYWFAWATRQNPMQFLCYLSCDLARVCWSFFRRFRLL